MTQDVTTETDLQRHLQAARPRILAEYAASLRAVKNPLGTATAAEVEAVVGPLVDAVCGMPPPTTELSERVGRSRASHRLNPVYSLRASGILYSVTAKAVMEGAAAGDAETTEVAVMLNTLHKAILCRVEDAAIPYAKVLLKQITDAHAAERARIARDLHDRSAHALALAFQQLELRRIHLGRGDIAEAEASLESLSEQLRDAAEMIREISQDIGSTHTQAGLEAALADYVRISGGARVSLVIDDQEEVGELPVWVREQTFLSIREAVRNAVLHSHSESISIRVSIRHGNLIAVVRDDGVGLLGEPDIAQCGQTSGSGMRSMTERIEGLGGSVAVHSDLGLGVTVEFTVPLP